MARGWGSDRPPRRDSDTENASLFLSPIGRAQYRSPVASRIVSIVGRVAGFLVLLAALVLIVRCGASLVPLPAKEHLVSLQEARELTKGWGSFHFRESWPGSGTRAESAGFIQGPDLMYKQISLGNAYAQSCPLEQPISFEYLVASGQEYLRADPDGRWVPIDPEFAGCVRGGSRPMDKRPMAAAGALIDRFDISRDGVRFSSQEEYVNGIKTREIEYSLERCWGPGRTVETLTVQLEDGRLQSAAFREETVPVPGCCGNDVCPELIVTPSSSSTGVWVSFEPVDDALAEVGLCGTHMFDPCFLPTKQLVVTSADGERNVDLTVELVGRADQLGRELTIYEPLDEHSGMLQVFAEERRRGYWEGSTHIPLDFAFLGTDGTVQEVRHGEPGYLEFPATEGPYRYVLEVNGGWFERHGFGVGDRVLFPADTDAARSGSAEARIEHVGYFSNGDAEFILTGRLPGVVGPAALRIACVRPNLSRPASCPERIHTIPSDGGSAFETRLRIPMGESVNVDIQTPDGGYLAPIPVEAPERILGIERFVWECYIDRAPEYFRTRIVHRKASETAKSCSGWPGPTVRKWDYDRPLRIEVDAPTWRDDLDDEYWEVADRALDELSELVDIEIEHGYPLDQLNLTLYVGLDEIDDFDPFDNWGRDAIGRIHQDCLDEAGCAVLHTVPARGVVGGQAVCWSAPSSFDVHACVLHQLIHIVAGIDHRDALDVRSNTLSVVDRELLRLNGHRLVKPGMTMDQVRQLVVFEDELLDSAGTSSYGRLWRAAESLRDAGSMQIAMRSQGTWQSCQVPFWWIHGEIRIAPKGESEAVDLSDLADWYPESANLERVLRQILAYGDATEFDRTDLAGGEVRLTAALVAIPGDPWVILHDVSFTLTESTGELIEFAWTIPENASGCEHQIEGRNTEIGATLTPLA